MNQLYISGTVLAMETMTAKSGLKVCKFTLEVANKKGAEGIPVVAFGQTAEIAEANLKQGGFAFITGKVSIDKRTTKEGKTYENLYVAAYQVYAGAPIANSFANYTATTLADEDVAF